MPTLTFYVTQEVAMQLERLIERKTKKLGFPVSRGDIIVPHIKKEFNKEFSEAHWIGGRKAKSNTPATVTGEIGGVASGSPVEEG
jgi:hypothetical protein